MKILNKLLLLFLLFSSTSIFANKMLDTTHKLATNYSFQQQAYLKASNADKRDEFGRSVAISGDTMVIGAWNESSGVGNDESDNSANGAGAVYVFVRTDDSWSQQAYLKASNAETGDSFGYSVAISGDVIVVGAYREASNATGIDGDENNNSMSDAGAAYVFERTGTSWSQQAYLKASNTDAGDLFGYSVAISGDTIAIGAYKDDGVDNAIFDSGAVYIFTRSGTTWGQQTYIRASNSDPADYFGSAVAIAGNNIIVGAYGEDSNATGINSNETNNLAKDSGAAYVFTRSLSNTWNQQAYIKASNTGIGDYFGYAVDIIEDTIAVGAYEEDSNAIGVNGNKEDNTIFGAGAAYVFAFTGTSWVQQAYLKYPNPRYGIFFGASVALAEDTLVVGAYREGSNAIGVNGSGSNNSAGNSGAAYTFIRSSNVWTPHTYIKASNTQASDEFGIAVAISGSTLAIGAHWEDSNGSQISNSKRNSGAVYVFNPLPDLIFINGFED